MYISPVDRQANDRDGLRPDASRAALKKFPGCEDLAETMFPPNDSSL